MELAALFPEGAPALHLTLRRLEPAAFFGKQDPSGRVLQERCRWLDDFPARHAQLRAAGAAGLAEFLRCASRWDQGGATALAPSSAIETVGRHFEPDLLFLTRDEEGEFRLQGGALCFPSGWALEEKIGHSVDHIHDIVPGLNTTLGPAIRRLLGGLKPGVVLGRDNWGLAACAELNLHPARRLPPPAPPVRLDSLWLRVEHQGLLALPESGCVVFGIRVALHRLSELQGTAAGLRLAEALRALPETLAAYKRIAAIREVVSRVLEENKKGDPHGVALGS